MKIYTCIVGDLFHYGHVNFLKQASELGDFLLVGICSDNDCELYKRKPIMNLQERSQVIRQCIYVNDVLLSPPSIITNDFIDKNQIDLIVHGSDSDDQQTKYFYEVAIKRQMYKTIPYTLGISTTQILNRIISRQEQELTKKNFLF